MNDQQPKLEVVRSTSPPAAKPRPGAPSRPFIRWLVVIAWLTSAIQVFVGFLVPNPRDGRAATR